MEVQREGDRVSKRRRRAQVVRRSSLHRCEPDQVRRVCLSRCVPSRAAPPLQRAIEARSARDGEDRGDGETEGELFIFPFERAQQAVVSPSERAQGSGRLLVSSSIRFSSRAWSQRGAYARRKKSTVASRCASASAGVGCPHPNSMRAWCSPFSNAKNWLAARCGSAISS